MKKRTKEDPQWDQISNQVGNSKHKCASCSALSETVATLNTQPWPKLLQLHPLRATRPEDSATGFLDSRGIIRTSTEATLDQFYTHVKLHLALQVTGLA